MAPKTKTNIIKGAIVGALITTPIGYLLAGTFAELPYAPSMGNERAFREGGIKGAIIGLVIGVIFGALFGFFLSPSTDSLDFDAGRNDGKK